MENEFEKILKIYIFEAKETKIIRQKFKDGSFLNNEKIHKVNQFI